MIITDRLVIPTDGLPRADACTSAALESSTRLCVRRVANGFVVGPPQYGDGFHFDAQCVARDPQELSLLLLAWGRQFDDRPL